MTVAPPIPTTLIAEEAADDVDMTGGEALDDRNGYCFYRRADGWITHGQANATALDSYRKRGMEPLWEFGRFVLNPPVITNARKQAMPQWQPWVEPYDAILVHPDGPRRFTVEQVIAHGWHRGKTAVWYEYLPDGRWKRHRKVIEFPQLAGVEIDDVACQSCGRQFSAKEHLRRHVEAAHPERGTILHLAETQEAIAHAVAAGAQGATDPVLVQLLGRLTEVVESQGKQLNELARQVGGRERKGA